MKAIVYLRVSQDRSGEAIEVPRQREDCLKRCTDRRWEVVAVEADNDITATVGKRRPGFEALLEQVRGRTADVIVAWSLDRLTLNSRDEMRLYETCLQARVGLSLVHGADVDMSSATGRRLADVLESSARHEVAQRGERQCNAVVQAVEQGRRIGGHRPFGYEPDGMMIRVSLPGENWASVAD
ncbi:MAG: recombinase family protein [Geodermatophilaceae bacterium]